MSYTANGQVLRIWRASGGRGGKREEAETKEPIRNVLTQVAS